MYMYTDIYKYKLILIHVHVLVVFILLIVNIYTCEFKLKMLIWTFCTVRSSFKDLCMYDFNLNEVCKIPSKFYIFFVVCVI